MLLTWTVCKAKACASVGKWYSRFDCKDRGVAPSVVCDTCIDSGMVATVGAGGKGCQRSLRQREELLSGYMSRRDPTNTSKEMLVACPWLVDIRCAPNIQLRQGILRTKKQSPPTNLTHLEGILAPGGEAPAEGTLSFLTAAHSGGVGSQANRVALGSLAGVFA